VKQRPGSGGLGGEAGGELARGWLSGRLGGKAGGKAGGELAAGWLRAGLTAGWAWAVLVLGGAGRCWAVLGWAGRLVLARAGLAPDLGGDWAGRRLTVGVDGLSGQAI